MAKYFYKALKDQKELVTGYIEANSQKEARDAVRRLGFLPTNIYEEIPENKKSVPNLKKFAGKKLSLSDKISFTSELQVLLSSGISILESLESVAKYSPKPKIERIANELSLAIKSGATFSEALRMYPDVFGEIYIALCYSGETAGSLPEVLNYILSLLKKQSALKGKLIQMSIYPAILILMLIVLFFGMGGFVFPMLINSLSVEQVPPMVSVLTDSVSFIYKYWWFMLIAGVGCVYGINILFGLDKLKTAISKFLMKIPLIAACVQYFSLAHYMSVLHIAYESGIPIVEAMNMAEKTISNDVMRKHAEDVVKFVSEGQSLTDAYYKSQLIPGILMPLIATGEKTGKLGQMFRDASIAIEKKLDMAIKALASAFEPALIIIIGICVGYFLIAFIQMYTQGLSSIINAF